MIYLDESGFSYDAPRSWGYAFKGTRCVGVHDWGAKGRINVIGALMGKDLLTVSFFESSIDTDVFTSWLIQDLIPKIPKNSVIIMDNASFHKGNKMQNAIALAGHTLLYLPTYSPDLNPIERKWAQAKSIRRKHRCSIHQLFTQFIN